MSDSEAEKSSEVPHKKLKTNDSEDEEYEDSQLLRLHDFIPEKVLNNNTNKKTVCILGKFPGNDDPGLIFLEKNPFRDQDLDKFGYFSEDCHVVSLFQNDIYGKYMCYPKPIINGVKGRIIYPATETHIAKYSVQEIHIINETPELYETLTLPHITTDHLKLEWIDNVLEGKSEQERVIYENKCPVEGFVLAPDMKWDGIDIDTLYILAIVRHRGIKSLRDLDDTHLPLLKRVRDEGQKAIFERYGVPASKQRIFIHYRPSYYHLHIHFTHLGHETVGVPAGKSHLLETVIDNITMMPQYYKKATLPFCISELDKLFEIYEANGHVQRTKSGEQHPIDHSSPEPEVV